VLLLGIMLPLSVYAQPALNLTVVTDKKTYYLRENVKVDGTFQNDSSPISDALVAIQVIEPDSTFLLFRTVTTGTVPESTPIVRVKNISLLTGEAGSPTDTFHIPIPFPQQLFAYFLVTLESYGNVDVTFTLTVFDENMVCLGSDFSVHRPLPSGNHSFTYRIPINPWTSTGTATVCANLYTNYPYLSGYPLSPENSTTFQIVRGTETASGGNKATKVQTKGANGTYRFNFTLSCQPKIGTYAVYSSAYGPPTAKANTKFNVDPLYSNPKAVFYWTPLYPHINDTITFDASSSMPDGGTIVSYAWKFGDGTPLVTESDPITTHDYKAAGTYTVTLNVTDSEGKWGAASQPVEVFAAYNPTASFTYSPSKPFVNGTITFDASSSTPGWNGTAPTTIVSYAWDFGDGTPPVAESDPVTTHIYITVGNYTGTLNVTDTMGWWDTTSQTLEVHIAELNLTITTDKPERRSHYYLEMDPIPIRGNLTFYGNPVADGLVALEVDNPNGRPVVFRTLKTGTAPISGAVVNIMQLFLCDGITGEPIPSNSIKKDSRYAYFNVSVENLGNEPLSPLITISIYQNLYSLGVEWTVGPVSPGHTLSVIFSFVARSFFDVGNATVYASVFSTFPRIGGYPYCEEKSSTFRVVDGSAPPPPPPSPPSGINGTYSFVFKAPIDAREKGFIQGTYTICVSTYYGPQQVTNSTTIVVKLCGDVDGDGYVSADDVFTYLSPAYGTKLGNPKYNPACDFDANGFIDADDVFTYLAPFYGKKA